MCLGCCYVACLTLSYKSQYCIMLCYFAVEHNKKARYCAKNNCSKIPVNAPLVLK